MDATLPSNVTHFIQECIDRLETLDLLMVLQSTRGRAWTVGELSGELRSSPLAVETSLRALVAQGLVGKDGTAYAFRPWTPRLEEIAVQLALLYRERRTAVIREIFSRPTEAARGFAGAFRTSRRDVDG